MTPRPARRTVVFDLDGTLIDSLPLVLAAIQYAIEPFGGRTSKDIFSHLGGPPERFLGGLVGNSGQVPEALRRLNAYHHEHLHLIRPYAGTRPLLEFLASRGVRAAVWTGRDRESTDSLLAAHGLGPLLATAVCGDDLPSHKPDPEGLREIIARLGTTPGDVLLVGDADVDVLGGHACGVDTVLIRHERPVAPGVRAKAWQVVDSPDEAYALVRRSVADAA